MEHPTVRAWVNIGSSGKGKYGHHRRGEDQHMREAHLCTQPRKPCLILEIGKGDYDWLLYYTEGFYCEGCGDFMATSSGWHIMPEHECGGVYLN